ncbi:hypothetical protein D3C86_866480 [compost metagenome]
MHRHRFAELRGDAACPSPGAVQQPGCVQLHAVLRAYAKALAVVFHGGDRALLMYLHTVSPRRPGERRGHQTRIGVTVIRAIRGAHRDVSHPWKTAAQLGAVKHLQVEAEALAAGSVVLQGTQIVCTAGEFQVAAALIFAVDANQLRQLRPDGVGTLRQRQLRQRSALAADATVVDAAGMGTAEVPLQQHHATPGLAEKQRRRSTHNAAADDHCVDFDHASISRPKGSGLMGAWARSRPMSDTARRLSQAMISAAAAPHIRP